MGPQQATAIFVKYWMHIAYENYMMGLMGGYLFLSTSLHVYDFRQFLNNISQLVINQRTQRLVDE